MTQDGKDQDRAVLAFLTGVGSADTGEDLASPATPQLSDDVDESLRAMGYNRPERERLRRGQSRPRNEEKYLATTIKRFEYYIERELTGRTPDEIAGLARARAGLTNYDLDLARRWWDGGVNPGSPDRLVEATEAGFGSRTSEESYTEDGQSPSASRQGTLLRGAWQRSTGRARRN